MRTLNWVCLVKLNERPQEVKVILIEDIFILEEGHILLPDGVVDWLWHQLCRCLLIKNTYRMDWLLAVDISSLTSANLSIKNTLIL